MNDLGIVTVFGGTGFLGRRIVARLLEDGIPVRVAVRHPDRLVAAKAAEAVEAIRADVRDDGSVHAAIAGAGAVINAVGLYVERGDETFDAVHVAGALRIARESARAKVRRLVHLSGIGADAGSASRYVRARAQGEEAVRQAFADATILRPSVLFGPGDAFVNGLARIVRQLPAIPLFGDGRTRLQPVFVDDVAAAAVRACSDPAASGSVFELGGARIYTYREILKMLCRQLGRRRMLIPTPFVLWRLLARASAVLPRPPLTLDQVMLMQTDNVVGELARGFGDLGLTPTEFEPMLQACLQSD